MNGKFFTDDDGDLILPEALKIVNVKSCALANQLFYATL